MNFARGTGTRILYRTVNSSIQGGSIRNFHLTKPNNGVCALFSRDGSVNLIVLSSFIRFRFLMDYLHGQQKLERKQQQELQLLFSITVNFKLHIKLGIPVSTHFPLREYTSYLYICHFRWIDWRRFQIKAYVTRFACLDGSQKIITRRKARFACTRSFV